MNLASEALLPDPVVFQIGEDYLVQQFRMGNKLFRRRLRIDAIYHPQCRDQFP